MIKGIYLAFEGGEGLGKSTQASLLVSRLTEQFPERKIVLTREPGGSDVAEEIRQVNLKKRDGEKIDKFTEAYLFTASRAQTLRTIVAPILEEGGIVISDRTFYSSIAYQGFGRRLGWETVWEINKIAVGETKPNLVYLFDGDPKVGLERINKNNREKNRLEEETLEFHQRVRDGFLFLRDQDPSRFVTIDGCLGIQEQCDIIWGEFCQRFIGMKQTKN